MSSGDDDIFKTVLRTFKEAKTYFISTETNGFKLETLFRNTARKCMVITEPLFQIMDSVSATDKAENWQALNNKDLDREREDQENLDFCDEREFIFRKKCKKARQDVRELEARKAELEAIVDRTTRLCRTEIEYWEEGDIEFWQQYQGKVSCFCQEVNIGFHFFY